MKYNLYTFAIAVITIIICFAVIYTLALLYKFQKRKNLILDRKFLNQLFDLSTNKVDASKGANGDISIETVTFCSEDFHFSETLKIMHSLLEKEVDDSL